MKKKPYIELVIICKTKRGWLFCLLYTASNLLNCQRLPRSVSGIKICGKD